MISLMSGSHDARRLSFCMHLQMGGLDGLKECGAVALTLQPKTAVLLQCTPRRLAAAL